MKNNIGDLITSNQTQELSTEKQINQTVGRPREFRNAAEKQKAYRDRKKASTEQQIVMNEMVAWFQQQEVSLRNWIGYWQKKGKNADIVSAGLSADFGQAIVAGYSIYHIESGVWKYLLLTGAVVPDGSQGFRRTYTLCPVVNPANAGSQE